MRNKIPPNFQGCWGKNLDENMIWGNIHLNILNSNRENWKKATPRIWWNGTVGCWPNIKPTLGQPLVGFNGNWMKSEAKDCKVGRKKIKIPWLSHDFFAKFSFSMTFSGLDFIFPFSMVFHDYPWPWEPCLMLDHSLGCRPNIKPTLATNWGLVTE